MRGLGLVLILAASGSAIAQPKTLPPLEGATELVKLPKPAAGFFDDAIAADGERLVYAVSDSASKSELHVVTLATKAEMIADVSAATLHPIAIQLAGNRALVIGVTEDGKQNAALVELADKGRVKAGTIVYKVAPATRITVITRDGAKRVAVYRESEGSASTKHEVELLALETGRRVGAARTLELAGTANKALDFRVNHWSEGYTRAHGLKGGEWDRKENQRSPDTEATYDMVLGKLVDKKKIDDLFEQRRRFQTLASAEGKLDFVLVTQGKLELWRAGKGKPLELDQPLSSYDTKSLQYAIQPDGSLWLALKIDPVNAEAVARQKADPEYLDIFRAAPDGKAVRKARVLAKGVRHRFGPAGGDKFWLLERNQSMERGGKGITVYSLQ